MPVAGLVVTLTDQDALREACVASLARDPRITLGSLQRGHRLPLAVATDSVREEQALFRAIADTPGVLLLDLVFHDFSDVGALSSDDLPRRHARTELCIPWTEETS